VKPDIAVKEGTGDRRHSVGVAKRDEVRVLGEAIDDSEDDRLAADPGQPLDKVHEDVSPHLGWHGQGLQQARRL